MQGAFCRSQANGKKQFSSFTGKNFEKVNGKTRPPGLGEKSYSVNFLKRDQKVKR